MITALSNHLWQSTVFAAAILLLSLVLRNNRAHVRYWLWFAASLKFLLPLSAVSLAMSHWEWRSALAVDPTVSHAVVQLSEPFARPAVDLPLASSSAAPNLNPALAVVWLAGTAILLLLWFVRWRRIARLARLATLAPMPAPIPVLVSCSQIEPGVFGIVRPVLLLPAGILDRLNSAQLDAVLAHELCHVRRRDNLTAAIHMFVEAVFWFHPLVWWIGKRLLDERESACDEAVLGQGNQPRAYAEGILNVCKHYVQTPLACASGVTGADLKRRVTSILSNRASLDLTLSRKTLLAAATCVALGIPLILGLAKSAKLVAQTAGKFAYRFEVASVRPTAPGERGVRIGPGPQGGIRTMNTTLRGLITFAYKVQEYQVEGGPDWVNNTGYDVTGTPDQAEDAPNKDSGIAKLESFMDRHRIRTQALLEERFGLVLRKEPREIQTFALVLGKNGPKIKPLPSDVRKPPNMRTNRGVITGSGITMDVLCNGLSNVLGRTVRNETNLDGLYDFTLEWTPEAGPPPGSSAANEPVAAEPVNKGTLFSAVSEQLGLKLETRKGPVDFLIVEKAEKPTEN